MDHEAVRAVISRTALVDALKAPPAFLRRVERLGLLNPVARTARHELYYPAEVLERLVHVQSLLAAGYAEKDIGHVLGRVVAEVRSEPALVCTASELAVAPEVLDTFLERRLVEVWGETSDGQRLFAVGESERVRVLCALEELGLAVSLSDFEAPPERLVSRIDRIESQLLIVRIWLRRGLGKRSKTRLRGAEKPLKKPGVAIFSRRKRV